MSTSDVEEVGHFFFFYPGDITWTPLRNLWPPNSVLRDKVWTNSLCRCSSRSAACVCGAVMLTTWWWRSDRVLWVMQEKFTTFLLCWLTLKAVTSKRGFLLFRVKSVWKAPAWPFLTFRDLSENNVQLISYITLLLSSSGTTHVFGSTGQWSKEPAPVQIRLED